MRGLFLFGIKGWAATDASAAGCLGTATHKHLFIKIKGKKMPRPAREKPTKTSVHFLVSPLHLGEGVFHNHLSLLRERLVQAEKQWDQMWEVCKTPTQSQGALWGFTITSAAGRAWGSESSIAQRRRGKSEQKRTLTPGKQGFGFNKWADADDMEFTFKSQSCWGLHCNKVSVRQ